MYSKSEIRGLLLGRTSSRGLGAAETASVGGTLGSRTRGICTEGGAELPTEEIMEGLGGTDSIGENNAGHVGIGWKVKEDGAAEWDAGGGIMGWILRPLGPAMGRVSKTLLAPSALTSRRLFVFWAFSAESRAACCRTFSGQRRQFFR